MTYKQQEERLIIPTNAVVKDGDDLHIRDFKGIWIPASMFNDNNLNPTEMILLAEIDSLDSGEGCYASNRYLATKIKTTEGRCANIISNLKKRGYVLARKFDGRKRYISVKADFTKTLTQGSRKREGRVNENVNIDTSIDTSIDTNNNRSTSRSSYSPEFEQFWERQIRKIDKQGAWKEWKRACKHNQIDISMIIAAWEIQRLIYKKRDIEFVPHPRKWLHNHMWEDDIASIGGNNKNKAETFEEKWGIETS